MYFRKSNLIIRIVHLIILSVVFSLIFPLKTLAWYEKIHGIGAKEIAKRGNLPDYLLDDIQYGAVWPDSKTLSENSQGAVFYDEEDTDPFICTRSSGQFIDFNHFCAVDEQSFGGSCFLDHLDPPSGLREDNAEELSCAQNLAIIANAFCGEPGQNFGVDATVHMREFVSNARDFFNKGYVTRGVELLGKGSHYLQDMTMSHHVSTEPNIHECDLPFGALNPGKEHSAIENWADENFDGYQINQIDTTAVTFNDPTIKEKIILGLEAYQKGEDANCSNRLPINNSQDIELLALCIAIDTYQNQLPRLMYWDNEDNETYNQEFDWATDNDNDIPTGAVRAVGKSVWKIGYYSAPLYEYAAPGLFRF